MTKEQMEQFLKSSLHLNNPELKEAVIRHVLDEGFKENYKGWEQLRFIKRQFDILWGALKKCSEQEIVRERIEQLISSFPRPTVK